MLPDRRCKITKVNLLHEKKGVNIGFSSSLDKNLEFITKLETAASSTGFYCSIPSQKRELEKQKMKCFPNESCLSVDSD